MPEGSAVIPPTLDNGPLLCVQHAAREYIVVEKPTRLHSVPGRTPEKYDSIETRVQASYPHAHGPLMVHRLDMETSGLMVVALTKKTHRAIMRQFMHRKVGKRYQALLNGVLEQDEGLIDLPIAFDYPNRPRHTVDAAHGKPAQTRFKVMHRDLDRRITRVVFKPVTGRTHQLRVHASTPRDAGGLGAPILGDSLYGSAHDTPRLMLHASFLAFWEPGSRQWVKFSSPPPF
jgi:tRNA pseudouridine32 synthase/23S rRNA pseudouridine746 synthase